MTEVFKIAANGLWTALCFIKIFHDVAILPGEEVNGEVDTFRVDHYYSICDKFGRENLVYLLWVTVAAIAASVIISSTIIVKDNKKIRLASHIAFGLSTLLFLVSLLVAAGINYCY